MTLDSSDMWLFGPPSATRRARSTEGLEGLLVRVRQMSERGEHLAVIDLLDRQRDSFPPDARLHTALGWASENLEPPDMEAARLAYERALELEPDHLEAMDGLANVLSSLGDVGAAKDLYRRVIDLIGDSSTELRPLEIQGWCLYKLDEPDRAVQVFSKALKLEPGAVAIRFDLGLALLAAGEVSKAVDAYGTALRDLREVPQPRRVGALIVAIADLDAGILERPAIKGNYAAPQLRSRLGWELSEAKRARDTDTVA
jgi:tetratricopeptide (TPR) repeat protein